MRLNRRFALFLVLMLIAGVLSYQRRRVAPVDRFATRVIDVVARPVEWVAVGVRDRATGATHFVTHLFQLRRENLVLRRQVSDLERALREREEDRLENERLRRLLALPELGGLRELPAHVIGSDPTNWFRTVRIDRGLVDGVNVDSPVIADGGVVGHVIEATAHRARVLLLVDSNCRVAAILRESRGQGLIEGRNAAALHMTYVDSLTEVQPGEAVVTSGMGGIYPKGLLIGRVTNVRRQENEIFLITAVAPSVDFARLENVIVLLPQDAIPATTDDAVAAS